MAGPNQHRGLGRVLMILRAVAAITSKVGLIFLIRYCVSQAGNGSLLGGVMGAVGVGIAWINDLCEAYSLIRANASARLAQLTVGVTASLDAAALVPSAIAIYGISVIDRRDAANYDNYYYNFYNFYDGPTDSDRWVCVWLLVAETAFRVLLLMFACAACCLRVRAPATTQSVEAGNATSRVTTTPGSSAITGNTAKTASRGANTANRSVGTGSTPSKNATPANAPKRSSVNGKTGTAPRRSVKTGSTLVEVPPGNPGNAPKRNS